MVLIVVDATSLERNLNLVFQILDITPNVIVCVNLLDEAKKKGISVNLKLIISLVLDEIHFDLNFFPYVDSFVRSLLYETSVFSEVPFVLWI